MADLCFKGKLLSVEWELSITLDYYVPVAEEKGKEGNLGKAEIR